MFGLAQAHVQGGSATTLLHTHSLSWLNSVMEHRATLLEQSLAFGHSHRWIITQAPLWAHKNLWRHHLAAAAVWCLSWTFIRMISACATVVSLHFLTSRLALHITLCTLLTHSHLRIVRSCATHYCTRSRILRGPYTCNSDSLLLVVRCVKLLHTAAWGIGERL